MSEFKSHYIYKLLTNLLRIPVTFILQALFPRLLGAANYGNFDFLIDSANKFIGFLETGTSIAFYTKLSQKNTDRPLIKFYWILIFFISLLYLLFVGIMGLTQNTSHVWPNQRFFYVFLSALWGLVTLYSNTAFKIMDACNATIKAERLRMFQLFLSVLVFGTIYWLQEIISLDFFFYVQIGLVGVLIIGSAILLRTSGFTIFPAINLTSADIRKYSRILWDFSSPLLLYSVIGLIAGIGDRWILQKFGGSIQQAFFGISYRVGAFVFLFTSAMMPLLMREYSKLFADNKINLIQSGFIQNFKILYFLASFLAIFVAFNAGFIIEMLAGSEFVNAKFVVILMAFYPIHQTLGQLNGTVYYSTSRTREYRNIGLSLMPFGLAMSFILIAPEAFWGYDLGAVGLAIQMLIMQFITVNIMLFYNCKFLKTPYFKLLGYQLLILAGGSSVAYVINWCIKSLNFSLAFINPVLFFMAFTLVSASIILTQPLWIGLQRSQLTALMKSFNRK